MVPALDNLDNEVHVFDNGLRVSHDLHQACLAAMRSRGLAILFEDGAPPHQPDGLIVAVSAEGE